MDSIDSNFQRQLNVVLEDIDVAISKVCTLKKNLNVADEFISELKDQASVCRERGRN